MIVKVSWGGSGVWVEEEEKSQETHRNRLYMFGNKEGNSRLLQVSKFRVKVKGPWSEYKSRSWLGKSPWSSCPSSQPISSDCLVNIHELLAGTHGALPSGLYLCVTYCGSLLFFTYPTLNLYKTTCSILSIQSRTVFAHLDILFGSPNNFWASAMVSHVLSARKNDLEGTMS